jgi:hypothetical protein
MIREDKELRSLKYINEIHNSTWQAIYQKCQQTTHPPLLFFNDALVLRNDEREQSLSELPKQRRILGIKRCTRVERFSV